MSIAPVRADTPFLEHKIYLTPRNIRSLGKRKVRGEIIAVWQKRNLLLQEDDGRIVRVRLSHRAKSPPGPGLCATVCGYPETDQFNIILGTATISSTAHEASTQQSPVRLMSLADVIVKSPSGSITFKPSYYGKLITLGGTLAAGASGAVMKSADDSTLLTAVRTVASGKRFISPEVKGLLAFDPPAPTLSPRQREVLLSLAKGFNNTEIANQLGISRTVVKEHVETLLVKLGAANRTEAAAIALRKNLIKV